MTFTAIEYDKNVNPTGRKLTFMANTIEQAVLSCLYTYKLASGNARIGPSGLVVYDGKGYSACFSRERVS